MKERRMKPFDRDDLFGTSDFLTAAFLMAKGVQMFGKRSSGPRITFLFLDPHEGWCEKLSRGLLYGRDQVSARSLHDAMKRLKKIIYG